MVRGYPEPDEVAALIAVLTVVAHAGVEMPEPRAAQATQAPAGAFVNRYQSPTSWQAS